MFKNKFKNKLIIACICFVVLVVFNIINFVAVECKPNTSSTNNKTLNNNIISNNKSNNNLVDNNLIAETQNILEFISRVKLPSKLDFCGELVPLENPEVKERAEREFYLLLQQPGQLVLYLKRAGKYFSIYEKIIAENNLPDDLKYLSVAESALYQSRSAKNAFGLWQFMEGTAKSYGLRVDEWVDERSHFEKSTRAALKYLKNGKDGFGSWTLAAAGYNMGNSGVRSAMNKQGVNNYYDLYLNEETSRFVFRIVIIKELMKNAAKYGLNFSPGDLYSFGKTKTIKLNTQIDDLQKWALEKNTTYKNLKILNPWMLKDKLPIGNWEIVLPDV